MTENGFVSDSPKVNNNDKSLFISFHLFYFNVKKEIRKRGKRKGERRNGNRNRNRK